MVVKHPDFKEVLYICVSPPVLPLFTRREVGFWCCHLVKGICGCFFIGVSPAAVGPPERTLGDGRGAREVQLACPPGEWTDQYPVIDVIPHRLGVTA